MTLAEHILTDAVVIVSLLAFLLTLKSNALKRRLTALQQENAQMRTEIIMQTFKQISR